MRETLLRRYRGIIFGIGMLVTVLLASACAGVPTNTTTTTGPSSTPSTTTTTAPGTTPGTNQATTTQQGATFEPGSIQFTGQVSSATASSIVVQMPDGPLTMNITPQTKLSHNNGLPASGQIVNVDALASNGGFTATKIEQADQKDQTKQNSVQYQGVTRSAVGTDNMLHLGVGTRTWNFMINSSTDLKNFNNNAQSIPANQSVKVDVQFSGTDGTAVKVDSNNGNN